VPKLDGSATVDGSRTEEVRLEEVRSDEVMRE